MDPKIDLKTILDLHAKWWRGGAGGVRADLRHANLIGADLSGADLRHANLIGADLSGADLRGANLIGANLIGADLSGADLRGANLIGADLSGANLIGANLIGAGKIKALSVFTGLYAYQCWAVVAEDGATWVRMGCLFKTVADWDALGIRKSNTEEFPDDGSEACEQRVRAFEFTRAEAVRLAAKFSPAAEKPKPLRDAKGHFVKESA